VGGWVDLIVGVVGADASERDGSNGRTWHGRGGGEWGASLFPVVTSGLAASRTPL
jgi:hypothetical protein